MVANRRHLGNLVYFGCSDKVVLSMSSDVKTVKLPADSELAVVLKDAMRAGTPVVVDTGEVAYSLSIGVVATKTATPSADTVARSEEGIRQAAGRWKDLVDADAFKAYLRERRRTSSRPSVRL
jgi:hypothetical protein